VQVEPLGSGIPGLAFAYTKGCELAVPIHSAFLDDYQDWRFVPPDRRA
jgi:gamma-glutamylaminecyclotransferase